MKKWMSGLFGRGKKGEGEAPKQPAPPAWDGYPPLDGPPPSGCGGLTVLIAEDTAFLQEAMVAFLRGRGVDTVTADDGATALALYRDDPARFDVIVMDLQMPGMDGREAACEIRRSGAPGSETIPIIAMSGNAPPEEVARLFDLYLQKPFQMGQLELALLRAVKRG